MTDTGNRKKMICYHSMEQLHIPTDTAVSIGKFDGFHRGHEALLERMKEEAGGELDTLVFRIGSASEEAGSRLLTEEEAEAYLLRKKITYEVNLPLSGAFRNMTKEDFAYAFLPEVLKAKTVIAGQDFRFGKNAAGDASFLKKAGEAAGYRVILLEDLCDGEEKISSTLIRNLLSEGDIVRANRCLGYRYAFQGPVVHGRALAGKLGFPTINIIPPEEKVLPRFGVYRTEVRIGGQCFTGLANIGVKPTVTDEKKPLLEVHLLRYDGLLYGQHAEVFFEEFIRPEIHFQSLAALKAQMKQDMERIEAAALYKEVSDA